MDRILHRVSAFWFLANSTAAMAALPSPSTTDAGFLSPFRSPGAVESAASDQVVHRFDFDERDEGNLESIPKFWEPLRGAGFPRYAGAGFDYETGRLAPPSFRLDSSGRNVAYIYRGPDTRVRPQTEHRIEGFIRPFGLVHSRACVSAHYVDWDGKPLIDTLARSRYFGGPGESEDWLRFELHLRPAPGEAIGIGLIVWVLQESSWSTAATLRRHISPLDVNAGAWVDDVTIFRLPRVRLDTPVPGNAVAPSDPRELRVLIADADSAKLSGRLTITDATGRIVATHRVSTASADSGEATRIPISELGPGRYDARLDMGDDDVTVLSRSLAFVILSPTRRTFPESLAKPFGLVIEPDGRADAVVEYALLKRQTARSLKVPVWTGLDEESPDYPARRAVERYHQELTRNRFLLTGVLWGPPSSIIRSHGAYRQPLIDLLAGERSAWESELAVFAASGAGLFRWWQAGGDGSPAPSPSENPNRALEHLRDALRVYMTAPRLAMPLAAMDDPDAMTPVDQVTLNLPESADAASLRDTIRSLRGRGIESVAVHAAPLPEEQYERLPRLGEWTRRVILARYAGADVVYAPQLWRSRSTPQGVVVEPLEEFVLFRTIGDVLGGASPGPELRMADGVRMLAFERNDGTVLAMWDDLAPPEGRPLTIQLGRAARQLDLWGRSTPLSRDESGRQVVRLSPMPTFVDQVDPWIVSLTTGVTLEPSRVESGTELARHELVIDYRGDQPLAGQGALVPPDGISVTPRSFALSVQRDRPQRIALDVRYAHNEPAGRKPFIARIDLSQPPCRVEIPVAVEVGLSDVIVSGTAVVEHDDLILRHVIRNRSTQVLHLRSTAVAPARERQYRPVTELRPGATQTVEYRFKGGREMIGRRVFLTLRELNDGPRIHNLELVVP